MDNRSSSQQKQANVLLVEDEPSLAFNLQLNLDAEGYKVRHVLTGQDAIETWEQDGPFDLVILDVMIPDCLKDFSHDYKPGSPRRDGLYVAKMIRKGNTLVPILMLTALAADEDRVKGLETGVDDYITKPFHLAEFLLKVRRALERNKLLVKNEEVKNEGKQRLSYQGYTLDLNEQEITNGQTVHRLTEIEAGMIKEFFEKPETVLTRQYFLETVWLQSGQVDTRTVDNFIRRLRVLFEQLPQRLEIESIRGRGYRMRPFPNKK